jgi:hypothetical protein
MERHVLRCEPAQPTQYRYLLSVQLGAGRALTVILKNPSQADATRRDPTVGKVEAWARRQGFGTVTYLNLFAYRSPYPAALNALAYAEAVGPDNDATLQRALAMAQVVVAGWGNPNGIDPARYQQRIDEVWRLLCQHWPHPIGHIGSLTQAGHPRHGLHWQGTLPLTIWQ